MLFLTYAEVGQQETTLRERIAASALLAVPSLHRGSTKAHLFDFARPASAPRTHAKSLRSSCATIPSGLSLTSPATLAII